MSYQARVFRVLIASPSDVSEEREIVVRTIQEWNDLNSADRQVVLLPLRWETHAAPNYGERPQDVINREIVDHCDLLVGVFWTRIGSPTGQSLSGTLEEIERVAQSGRPVMLYFSRAKLDPDQVDIDQLQKLREFKGATLPNALTENYASIVEFRDKLAKQLEIRLRSMLAESPDTTALDYRSVDAPTDIVFHLADPQTGEDIGDSIELTSTVIEITDFEKIPDYKPRREGGSNKRLEYLVGLSDFGVNKDYYRQRAAHFVQGALLRPLRFWLKNIGGVGARDLYFDIRADAGVGRILIVRASEIPNQPPSPIPTFGPEFRSYPVNPTDIIEKAAAEVNLRLEVRALQPKRELSPEPYLIGALEDCDVAITARIFADILPEPLTKRVNLSIKARRLRVTADTLLEELGVPTTRTSDTTEES